MITVEEFTLADICIKITSGGTPLRKIEAYFNGSIPWVKTKQVNYNRIYDSEEYITELALKNSSVKLIPTNSVIVAMYGDGNTAGRCAINKIPVTTNQACCNLIINLERADYNFVYYYLSTQYKKLVSLKLGGGQQNLNAKTLKEFKIPLPSLTTQHKIASILSSYDDLIENNLKRIKLLEELAQRTYEEWFVNFQVNGETLKVDNGTGLPEGWAKVFIGEFIQFQKGKKVNLIVENYQPGLEKVLLLDGIESGVYPYTNPSGQVVAERGDLLMLMDGARSSKVFFADRGVVGSTMARVVISNRLLSPTLLRNYFDYNFDLMRTNNTGAAIPHANKGFINSMLFPMPPEEVLKLWNDKAKPMYRLLETLKEQNRLLKEARDILLPRLMSGVIDVERAEEETLAIAAEPSSKYKKS